MSQAYSRERSKEREVINLRLTVLVNLRVPTIWSTLKQRETQIYMGHTRQFSLEAVTA